MARRRERPSEDPLDAILERVRRAHEEADGERAGDGARGEDDRLERTVARGGAALVDPGRRSAAHALGDADRLEKAPRPKVAPTRDTEKTLHRFRYPDRGADVAIDSGEGKSFEDPERTRTRIVTRRSRR